MPAMRDDLVALFERDELAKYLTEERARRAAAERGATVDATGPDGSES